VEGTGLADVGGVMVERQTLAKVILYAGGQLGGVDGFVETT
jgi:hypothetical protein